MTGVVPAAGIGLILSGAVILTIAYVWHRFRGNGRRGEMDVASIANSAYSHLAMETTDQLSSVFAALSDPTRRAILARLAEGDATVAELASPFSMRQPTISKHLRVLEEAGLIRTSKDAQRRPRSLVIGGPLAEVNAWLGPFREQWESRLDRLQAFLEPDDCPEQGSKK